MNSSNASVENKGTLVRPDRPLYSVLYNLANCYNDSAEIVLPAITTTKIAEFIAPVIMCRSFAIELLLKFFIAIKYPEAKSITDLGKRGVGVR